MRRLKLAVALLTTVICASQSAWAREPTDAERQELNRTVIAYEGALAAKDMVAVFNAMPPRAFEYLSEKSGVSVDQMKAMVGKLAAKTTDKLGPFDMNAKDAEFRELSDGTPFALIPTETIFSADDGQVIKSVSSTLAILEDGKWYLMRVNDARQLTILHAVYPEFTGVEFPRGTMELKD
jgi:hypothetical protein